MGGHHSTMTVDVSTSIVANAILTQSQSCLVVQQGTQIMNVSGTGNIFTNNYQNLTLDLSASCPMDASQQAQIASSAAAQIEQTLKDQEVAFTQWLDSSGDDVNSVLNQSVTTDINESIIQTCVANLSGTQIMSVSGQGNVFVRNVQQQTGNLMAQCLMSSSQGAAATTDISDVVNQSSQYTSQNFLAFISDAIESVLKSALLMAAVVFIVLICFVFIYVILTRKKSPAPAAAPRPT